MIESITELDSITTSQFQALIFSATLCFNV